MGSDILMGRQGDDYRKKEQEAKAKFENLDLNKLIRDIYMSAISKASEDYILEIEKTRKHFLSTSYTEEQAQERFNHYTDGIRIKNEDDDCHYRYIKNNFLIEHPDGTLGDLQGVIVNSLCHYLRSSELNHANKLKYIDALHQQIYESNKIQRQFMFFKDFAKNHIEKAKIQKPTSNKSYTQKQVAIAYFAMSKTITKENYKSILEKHTETSSDKILQKLIVKSSDLTSLTENKTADTKQLNNLKEAKRLLSGIKDQKASKVLDDYITTFTNKYDNFYN